MPHVILEYSANIHEKQELQSLLLTCHKKIAETLPTQLASCKGRVVEHAIYCVGDGNPKNAFVHLGVKVLQGRTPEQLKIVSTALLEILKERFHKSFEKLHLQITVEIDELQANYAKAVG